MVTPPLDSLDRLATTADFLSDGRNLLDLNPLSAGSEERKQLSGRMRLLHWASPHHSCTLHTAKLSQRNQIFLLFFDFPTFFHMAFTAKLTIFFYLLKKHFMAREYMSEQQYFCQAGQYITNTGLAITETDS